MQMNDRERRSQGPFMDSATGAFAIPMTIHYCWFGGSLLTPTAQQTLESWKRFAPGFSLKRWDESNAPIDRCDFVHKAYQSHKWAFVSDYVRFWVLYQFGGIYMDTGSELIKDITPLIMKAPFAAIEAMSQTVAAGLIVCCAPHDPIVKEVLDVYEELLFDDSLEFMYAHTVNRILTDVLRRHGLSQCDTLQRVDSWTILPSSYFDPHYGIGGFHIKPTTYSVHRSSASWLDPVNRIEQAVQWKVTPFIGHRLGLIVGRVVGEFKVNGIQGLPNLVTKARQTVSRRGNSSTF